MRVAPAVIGGADHPERFHNSLHNIQVLNLWILEEAVECKTQETVRRKPYAEVHTTTGT